MRYTLTLVTLILGAAVNAAPPSSEYDALEEFAAGNRKFTAGVYKELIKKEKGNIILSPFSAETVLALTNEGAKGETAEEFVTGLSLPSSKEKTQDAFKFFLPKLQSKNEDLKLLSANKIYAGKDVKLEPSFSDVARSVYNSGVENIDFAQNARAAGTINNWVESQTNKKIKNLLSPDSIDANTRLVLVNALYFSGKWDNPFETYATRPAKFYKSQEESSAVDVDTMHQTDYFNYYENPSLDAKFLELPYKGESISMVIVLPNKRDGLRALEEKVEEVLEPQPYVRERVDVALPKFTIETTIPFIPILKKLGIERAFDGRADLTGLSSTDKNLGISEVIQKAFINVTESGTEAAAATAVGVALLSAPFFIRDPINFHADHPFFYYIKVKHGITLFAGNYRR